MLEELRLLALKEECEPKESSDIPTVSGFAERSSPERTQSAPIFSFLQPSSSYVSINRSTENPDSRHLVQLAPLQKQSLPSDQKVTALQIQLIASERASHDLLMNRDFREKIKFLTKTERGVALVNAVKAGCKIEIADLFLQEEVLMSLWHLGKAAYTALENKQLPVFQRLVNCSSIDINQVPNFSFIFKYAIRVDGLVEFLQILGTKFDPQNRAEAVLEALKNNKVEIVRMLLQTGKLPSSYAYKIMSFAAGCGGDIPELCSKALSP